MANTALAIAARPTATRPVILQPFISNTTAIKSIERLTSAELCKRYIDYIDRKETTVKGYMTAIRRFSKWLSANNIMLQDAKRADVIAYRDYLANSDLKAGTRTQYFRAAKALIHWAYCEHLILEDIGDNVHGEKTTNGKHKRKAVKSEDVAQIAESIDRTTTTGKRLYAMFVLTVVNGLRDVEIERLNVGDIHQHNDTFLIYLHGKGHDSADQEQVLIPEVKKAIDDYLNSRADKYTSKSPLFVSDSNRGKPGVFKGYEKDAAGNIILDESGNPKKIISTGRMAANVISGLLKELLKANGIDDPQITAHSLRHCSASTAFSCGMQLYDVQHLMRHCDPKTTEIYIHTADDMEREQSGRRAIYDQLFNGGNTTEIIPELEKEIKTLTIEEQQALLAQIRAQKGGKA